MNTPIHAIIIIITIIITLTITIKYVMNSIISDGSVRHCGEMFSEGCSGAGNMKVKAAPLGKLSLG